LRCSATRVAPLAHPRIDDGLAGLALQVAEHRADRHPDARHDGRDVGVHQIGQLVPVTTVKGTHLGRHLQQAFSTGKELTTIRPVTDAVRAAL
jgi:hypothetical protein